MLLNGSQFRDLVSGRSRGPVAALLRAVLRAAEVPYASVVRLRNRRYDHGTPQRVGVPVVSVGNLTLGGTGKTPFVAWLARWYSEQGIRVAIVSRGYGASKGKANDEALELASQLPGIPHVQNPDRIAAARLAIQEHAAQLILLDDAFQHRRIARDCDIVLIDCALEPFGFGHVFPRGTLREPLAGLARAQVVALSRADLLTTAEREALRSELMRFAPQATWCELAHMPRQLVNVAGEVRPLPDLRGIPLAAFCAIGNPAGFRHTLEVCNYRVSAFREFPDHHTFSAEETAELGSWAERAGAAAMVCTHKDLVKVPHEVLASKPLWAVSIELDVLVGRNELEAHLKHLLSAVCPASSSGPP